MSDFRGIREKYNDISIVGSRSAGLMTEFKTEAGKPIYISETGEIVSEKSRTLRFNGKWVNVPSIHDGIEYSEDQLLDMLENNKIKPTSTHKRLNLAEKAAQKHSPSLMSEETIRNIEKKYSSEMTKRKATASEITEEPTTLKTPDAKAEEQMDNLMKIQDDPYLVVENDKEQKIKKYMSTLSEQDKEDIKNYLEKPTAKINSIEDGEQMSNFPKESGTEVDDQTITAFSEGGLKDEGGTVDPVSGNDVPSGSTQSEVRDDIPAQLSEGEFVFPADVVRYIGLENLMELRQKAKTGLQKMEDMGQMGNSEEATMSDDVAFEDTIDKTIEALPMAMGGAVPSPMKKQRTPFKRPVQNFKIGGTPQVGNPLTSTQTTPVATQPTTLPGFSSFIQQPARQQAEGLRATVESKEFIGPNGERVTIQFVNGRPATPVPDGYREMTAEEKAEAMKPKIEQPKVQRGDNRDDNQDDTPSASNFDRDIANDALGMIGTDNPAYSSLKSSIDAVNSANLKAGVLSIGSVFAPALFSGPAEQAKNDLTVAQSKMRAEVGKVQQTDPAYRASMIEKAVTEMQRDLGLDEDAARSIATELDAVSRGQDFNIEDDAIPEADKITVDGATGKISIGGKSLSDYATEGGSDTPSGPPGGSTVGDAGLADASAGVTGDPAGRSMGPSYSGPAEADQVGGDAVSEGGPESGNTEGSSFSKGGAVKPKRKKGLGRLT